MNAEDRFHEKEYEKLISFTGTPTVAWRRTGEICLVGVEFSLLTDWTGEQLVGGKKYIWEVSILRAFYNQPFLIDGDRSLRISQWWTTGKSSRHMRSRTRPSLYTRIARLSNRLASPYPAPSASRFEGTSSTCLLWSSVSKVQSWPMAADPLHEVNRPMVTPQINVISRMFVKSQNTVSMHSAYGETSNAPCFPFVFAFSVS